MSDSGHALRGPHFVVTVDGDIHGEDTDENREIVRRIHACVNACEGVSTDELEKGIIHDMQRVIADVVPLLKDRNSNPSQPQPSPQPQPKPNRPIVVETRKVTQ